MINEENIGMITVISDLDQLVAFSCRLLGTKRTFTCYCKLIVMKSKTLIMNFKRYDDKIFSFDV